MIYIIIPLIYVDINSSDKFDFKSSLSLWIGKLYDTE